LWAAEYGGILVVNPYSGEKALPEPHFAAARMVSAIE